MNLGSATIATRPVTKCAPCRVGTCDFCLRVYRVRSGKTLTGKAVLCRCQCRKGT